MIYRWKHPTLQSHLFGILQGFAEILDGLVTLTTLGFFASGFEMAVARYRALNHIKHIKAARARK